MIEEVNIDSGLGFVWSAIPSAEPLIELYKFAGDYLDWEDDINSTFNVKPNTIMLPLQRTIDGKIENYKGVYKLESIRRDE